MQRSLAPSPTDWQIFRNSLETASQALKDSSDLPTKEAIWSNEAGDYSKHSEHVKRWLGTHKTGALEMEYAVPAERHPDVVLGGDLRLQDFSYYSSPRLTNVPLHSSLYLISGTLTVSQACNCHPYNPGETVGIPAGDGPPPRHPLVVEYKLDAVQSMIPAKILDIVKGISVDKTKVYLNVQENQWGGSQILLRPHGMEWMFPNVQQNYKGVFAYAEKDNGEILLNETSSVHTHDGVASPSGVMVLDPGGGTKISFVNPEAFYSVVIYDSKAAITRHIFLTEAMRLKFEEVFFNNPLTGLNTFVELLTPTWQDFLSKYGI